MIPIGRRCVRSKGSSPRRCPPRRARGVRPRYRCHRLPSCRRAFRAGCSTPWTCRTGSRQTLTLSWRSAAMQAVARRTAHRLCCHARGRRRRRGRPRSPSGVSPFASRRVSPASSWRANRASSRPESPGSTRRAGRAASAVASASRPARPRPRHRPRDWRCPSSPGCAGRASARTSGRARRCGTWTCPLALSAAAAAPTASSQRTHRDGRAASWRVGSC